jgi:deoxycytidylate deaminase
MTKHTLTATVYDKRGRVLSVGHNNYLKSHPYQKSCAHKVDLPDKIFLHAEINALIKIKNGTPHKIKIERYGKSNNPLNAKPCPICELAIKEAGIKFVEYTVG